MKVAGIVALALGVLLALPMLMTAAYEIAEATGKPGADSALLTFDMTARSAWVEAHFTHDSTEPIRIGRDVVRTTPASGWDDPHGGEGTLEVELVDPAGVTAYRHSVRVEALGPMSLLSTGGVAAIHPKRKGRWTIRGRVTGSDASFAGSEVELRVNRRSRLERDDPWGNVLLAGRGLAGIALSLILLLAGVSLLLSSRVRPR